MTADSDAVGCRFDPKGCKPEVRRAQSGNELLGERAPSPSAYGERCKLPSGVRGKAAAVQSFWGYFIAQETRIQVWYIIGILPKPTPSPQTTRPILGHCSEGIVTMVLN